MKLYNIDFRKLSLLLLPIALRKPIISAYLGAMMQPLSDLHYRFLEDRQDRNYRIEHNSQVCHLRKALNDYFHLTREDGFEIVDQSIIGDWLIAYDEDEHLESRHLIAPDAPDAAIAYSGDVITITQGTFVVLCPSHIYSDTANAMPRVRSIVNQYRLVSRIPTYKLKQS